MRKYDWGQQQSKWKCKFHIRFPREKLEEGKRSVIYYSTYLISSPPSVVAMIQHYPSQGKKWNKGPAIYSSSRVWNINSLSPENCWCSTTEGISNQALRVIQSPEPTTSTIFGCDTPSLPETLMEKVQQESLGSGQVLFSHFGHPH